MRNITDVERRARLGRRHGISPDLRLPDPEAATRAMTVLHATEPATVYLSLLARVEGLRVEDVDRALYVDRTLVKQLAMRRTLFVFPRDLLPAAWGSASARVAAALGTRLAKEVVSAGLADDGEAWLERARTATLAHLATAGELTAAELREQVPELAGRVDLAPGKSYGGSFPLSPRILGQLGVEGSIVRGRNAGGWWASRPRWTLMRSWLGDLSAPLPEREGYAALVARWLATFGPGTVDDVQWWLGGTKGAVRAALGDVAAVEVSLDDGASGWVLPDDVDEVPTPAPWAALLPVLDPTVMGWKSRGFYLGEHGPSLFDSNGNAGTTAWWDGRVVGCWVQDPDGVVEVRLVEDVPAEGRALLAVEAERVTEWLRGQRISTVYSSPAMKEPR